MIVEGFDMIVTTMVGGATLVPRDVFRSVEGQVCVVVNPTIGDGFTPQAGRFYSVRLSDGVVQNWAVSGTYEKLPSTYVVV